MRQTALSLLACTALAAAACGGEPSAPDQQAGSPSFARAAKTADPSTRVAALAERINSRLEARGSKLRLGSAYFFTIGQGVPDFRRLRSGLRWTGRQLTYILDENGFQNVPGNASPAQIEQALVNARSTWEQVSNAFIRTTRIANPGGNIEFLDQIIKDPNGVCVDIADPNWPGPVAHIVTAGWIDPEYFSNCLGSDQIVAVTFSFFDAAAPDLNHDNYTDLLYVEQYFNPAFAYTTTDAVYLDLSAPLDVESVVLHENGHSLGLDHTGGPNPNQPFVVHPNGRLFSPTAVMNPAYAGGERRSLLPLDIAALRTLYATKAH